MNCSNCNKNTESVIRFVSIINGAKTEYNFCLECAHELGVLAISSFKLGDIFGQSKKQLKCSNCQTTISDFQKTGVFGCENCYIDLYEDIEPILSKVQKNTTHIGRTPQNTNNINNKNTTSKPKNNTNKLKSQNLVKAFEQKQILEQKLLEAIDCENFEEAALIRDNIKKL